MADLRFVMGEKLMYLALAVIAASCFISGVLLLWAAWAHFVRPSSLDDKTAGTVARIDEYAARAATRPHPSDGNVTPLGSGRRPRRDYGGWHW